MTCNRAPQSPPSPNLRLLCLAAALACVAPASAWAEGNPYYLGVSQSLAHESNLYRLGDGQVLAAGSAASRSDTVSTTSLFGGVDQSIGRQRVYGSAFLRANRYQHNGGLNNESYALNLGLDWSTVKRLSGTLSVGADQSLAQFNSRTSTNSIETKKNLTRTEQVNANFHLGVVTRYTAEASLGYLQRSYSATEYDPYEFQQTSGSLGMRYRPSNLLALGAALRLTRATYPRFSNVGGVFESDRLNRQDIDFTADWQPSGASQLSARLSPTRSNYDRNKLSDFSGLTGAASWAWQATGKLKLTTHLTRDTGQSAAAVNLGIFGTGVTDYSQTTTALQLRGAYDLSAKIALTSAVAYAHRALVNTQSSTFVAGQSTTGSDNTTTLALGARWTPYRSVQLGCDVSTENRGSSNAALSVPLGASSFSCYGQFTLQ